MKALLIGLGAVALAWLILAFVLAQMARAIEEWRDGEDRYQ